MIRRYDSIAALRRETIAIVNGQWEASRIRLNGDSAVSWYGGERLEDTLRMTETGDTRLVPAAEKLIESLAIIIETSRRIFTPSVAGSFPCVPDAIMGRPTPMRRLIHEQDEHTPITILVNTSSSGGIDASVLQKRGTTILALVMALTRIRPVSLQTVAIMHGVDNGETIITAEINTHPLDLATACYVLTSAGFARRLTYTLAEVTNRFNGHWPNKFDYSRPQIYYDYLRNTLSHNPSQTLVIGAAQLGDELLSNPIKWINDQIAKFTQREDEEQVA